MPMLAFLPELILFASAMGVLLAGVFGIGLRSLFLLSAAALTAALAAVLLGVGAGDDASNSPFVFDLFARGFKAAILFACLLALAMAYDFLRAQSLALPEFPVLLLLAATGMGVMVSAQDLLALYLGLELQSLSLYVLAAIRRDSARGSEAGIKYFVLGALASGFLLYGASLLYGLSGSTQFAAIAAYAQTQGDSLGLIFGLVFLLAGLAFKISAVPFHMWTPDVYDGAPTPVTGFFAVAPKLAAMALLARLLYGAFGDVEALWRQVILFLGLCSIALGAAAAIGQTRIKRLLAYSSIGNMGFVLLGLASGTAAGLSAAIFYLLLYGLMTIGVFACLLALRDEEGNGLDDKMAQLTGLSERQPFLAFCLALFMFSLAGLPPLAGFFAKFFLLRALVAAELAWLAVLAIVLSVIAAVYYLKVVRIVYLDEGAMPALAPVPRLLGGMAGVSALLVLVFFLAPAWMLGWTDAMAALLLPPAAELPPAVELPPAAPLAVAP